MNDWRTRQVLKYVPPRPLKLLL